MEGRLLPLFILAKKIEEKQEGPIVVVKTSQSRDETIAGEVLLTGEGTEREKMEVKVGERILFSPHAFRKFVHPSDKQEYLLVAQKDVMLIY